jgi:hypothetical protein
LNDPLCLETHEMGFIAGQTMLNFNNVRHLDLFGGIRLNFEVRIRATELKRRHELARYLLLSSSPAIGGEGL